MVSKSFPAVAIRLAATSLFGVEQFTLNARSVDVGISKRFLFLAPYAGIGRVWSVNTPMGNAEGVLDKVGDVVSYNFKLGLGF